MIFLYTPSRVLDRSSKPDYDPEKFRETKDYTEKYGRLTATYYCCMALFPTFVRLGELPSYRTKVNCVALFCRDKVYVGHIGDINVYPSDPTNSRRFSPIRKATFLGDFMRQLPPAIYSMFFNKKGTLPIDSIWEFEDGTRFLTDDELNRIKAILALDYEGTKEIREVLDGRL